MDLKRGVVDTKGYVWNIDIDAQINEALKEGFENMLRESDPYTYLSIEDGVVSVNVMLDYFTSSDPLVFSEPLRHIVWHAIDLYKYASSTGPEYIGEDGVAFLKPIRDALANEIAILDKWLATAEGEKE